MMVHPFVFEPIYKSKLWGGKKIFTHFDRPPTAGVPIGESWELADLEADASRVAMGPACGWTLTELVQQCGADLIGEAGLFEGRFPLLIKYLDARTSLSVQVHPTEAVARRLGGNVRVKHEAWYILAAEPGGMIYHGLEPGVDADTFRDAMLTGRVDGVLRKMPVQPGECYYLPSGTCHALGAGVLVAEVQTPSDITYRTYDWGRVDPNTGQSRELQLDQAIECIDFSTPSPSPMQERSEIAHGPAPATRLVSCPSFVIDQVQVPEGTEQVVARGEMAVWIVLAGHGLIESPSLSEPIEFTRGNVLLLPAGLPDARVQTTALTEYLEVTVPV